jgi:hypothetical protein
MEGNCAALPAAPVMGWGALLAMIGILVGVGSLGLGIAAKGR